MQASGWWQHVTPNFNDGTVCRELAVPFPLMPAVLGQLLFLADPNNWESVGDMSPAQCANLAAQMVEGYMASSCYLGAIVAFCDIPSDGNWALCDGSQLPRAEYERLWQACPSLRRTVPPSPEYLQLPDMAGKLARGTESGQTMETGGADEVVLESANMPRHAHTYYLSGTMPAEAPNIAPISVAAPPSQKVTGYVGQGQAFPIVPSHVTVHWCMRVK